MNERARVKAHVWKKTLSVSSVKAHVWKKV